MNKTDFLFPRDGYVELVSDFYADIDGAAAAHPAGISEGENWWCMTQTSRGKVLEKAGLALMHIPAGKIYGGPGSIKLFEALTYPANPRVPGFVFLVNLNETQAGRSVVLYADIFFQTGSRDEAAVEVLTSALRGVYDRHNRDFDTRYKGETGRIMSGLGSEAGVMDFLQEAGASDFVDDLLPAVLNCYRDIIDITSNAVATDQDMQAMNRHRARLVEWLTTEDIGIRFACESGVPLEHIEAYGYPPVVRY